MISIAYESVLKSNLTFSVCRTMFYRSKFSYARGKFRRDSANPKHEMKMTIPKHHKKSLFDTEPIVLAPKVPIIPKQKFDYFLVADFEATCDSPINVDPQEIIEFPVLKVNGKTFETESVFHSYVKPVFHPELSDFCTELTGIIQEMVDNQPEFKVVFQKFLTWLKEEQILKPGIKFAFVTCSDPDLDYFFPMQCNVSEIEVPDFMKRWINVKRSFCDIVPYTWPDNIATMLKYCELQHEGDLHSGIDDAKNVARVIKDLAERGLVFNYNGFKE